MMLYRAAGIVPEESKHPKLAAALAVEADRIVRAGCVSLTLAEWTMLGNQEKEALAAAGDALRSTTAALIGCAAASEEGAARVFAEADGGASLRRFLLARAAEKAATRAAAGLRETRTPPPSPEPPVSSSDAHTDGSHPSLTPGLVP